MGKRISKRVREEAAFICAVRASNPDIDTIAIFDMWPAPTHGNESQYTDEEAAVVLAFDAWGYVNAEDFRANYQHWAAAESALRTGWTP